MSQHIPTGNMPVCFMRGQTVRGVVGEIFIAKTQVSAGKLREATLMLSMATMSLETLARISPKKTVKEAMALRKRVNAAYNVVASKKTSTKTKLSALDGLFDGAHKLEHNVGLSCRYEA